jgi:hypothetical protein
MLYVNSGKLALAVMYLRRVRVVVRGFAAAPTHAAQDLGVGLRRPCRGQTCGGMLEVSSDAAAAGNGLFGRCAAGLGIYYRLYVNSGKLILAAMCFQRDRVAVRSFAAAPAHVSTVVICLRLRHKTSAWASGGPVGGRQTCGGMPEAMARVAPTRPATPR